MAAPGSQTDGTPAPPRDGNAKASASDTTIGKTNAQKTASGSRMNSRMRASVNSRAATRPSRSNSSRRCRPVSDMKTSSSVPWWLTTFGSPSSRDQLLGCVERDDAAVIDNGHPITEHFRLFHVMRGHKDRAAARPNASAAPELPPRLRVEPGGWLIQEQQVRIAGQPAGHRQPLFLSARQLADPAGPLAFELDRCSSSSMAPAVIKRPKQRSVSSTVSLSGSCVSCSWMPRR